MKWFVWFVGIMIALFFLVIDPTETHWLSVLWDLFWVVLFIVFAIFIYIPDRRHKKQLKKHDKEG